ncbi:amidohydrolase family protein [Candidatus Peregrinibacteria bacterium]|nr:MAG: amidohydrolase family protein [Candidatus Peregrinibacteria bacterium]
MSRNTPILWALALLVLVVQVALASPSLPPIVNVHESIEKMGDVVNLQNVMDELNIRTTVLHAIPEDLLYFSGEKVSLSKVLESNTLVEQIAKQAEESFEFFCTVDPNDVNRVQMLKDCLQEGAVGLKLYNGYTYSHVLPLDDPKLTELYAVLQEEKALLMLPVNAGEYKNELENVLTLYPNLEVICPHYCLSSKSLNRLTQLMTEYPNLYVDTSFGSTNFALEGFRTISENTEAYAEFFEKFQDRILFATDNIVTSYEDKDKDFLKDLYNDYIWILSAGEFESSLDKTPEDGNTLYKGLELPYTSLQKVFWKNWESLLE